MTAVTFASQPAWQYDLEATQDLVNGPWFQLPNFLSLTGATEGATAILHTNIFPGTACRVRRKEP